MAWRIQLAERSFIRGFVLCFLHARVGGSCLSPPCRRAGAVERPSLRKPHPHGSDPLGDMVWATCRGSQTRSRSWKLAHAFELHRGLPLLTSAAAARPCPFVRQVVEGRGAVFATRRGAQRKTRRCYAWVRVRARPALDVVLLVPGCPAPALPRPAPALSPVGRPRSLPGSPLHRTALWHALRRRLCLLLCHGRLCRIPLAHIWSRYLDGSSWDVVSKRACCWCLLSFACHRRGWRDLGLCLH